LFLNYEFPPIGGGAANANYYLLKEYSKISDIKIDLVTSSIDAFSKEKFSKDINIFRLNVNKKDLHYWRLREIIRYIIKSTIFSKKLIKKEKYNLIHAFFGFPCGVTAYYLKKTRKIPYMVSLRGSDVPGFNERFNFIYSALKPILKVVWKNADFVIANSEKFKNFAKAIKSDQKILVISNGVDVNEFKPKKKIKNRVLTVSRLIPRKGIEYLIKSIPFIKDKINDFEVVIIGDGPLLNDLKKLARSLRINNYVRFLGRVPHEKISDYYSESYCYVQPSLHEGMSNSLLEAIASGLPAIVTDTGGTKELVDETNGFIIGKHNERDIANALIKLFKNRNLRDKMGRNSRKKAMLYSWSSVAEAYLDCYRRML